MKRLECPLCLECTGQLLIRRERAQGPKMPQDRKIKNMATSKEMFENPWTTVKDHKLEVSDTCLSSDQGNVLTGLPKD